MTHKHGIPIRHGICTHAIITVMSHEHHGIFNHWEFDCFNSLFWQNIKMILITGPLCWDVLFYLGWTSEVHNASQGKRKFIAKNTFIKCSKFLPLKCVWLGLFLTFRWQTEFLVSIIFMTESNDSRESFICLSQASSNADLVPFSYWYECFDIYALVMDGDGRMACVSNHTCT